MAKLDSKVFDRANALFENGQDQVDLMSKMEQTYLLEWDPAFTGKDDEVPPWITEVKDPQPFMAVRWLTSIMSMAEPRINLRIPQEALSVAPDTKFDSFKRAFLKLVPEWVSRLMRSPEETDQLTDSLEQIVTKIMTTNDRRSRTRLLNDFLHAGFVHGRIVAKLADLRQTTMWKEAARARPGMSPFAAKCVDAKTVFAEWDELGLSAVLERYERPRREIERRYDANLSKLCEDDEDTTLVFNELWLRDKKYAWVEKVLAQGERIDPKTQAEDTYVLDDSDNGLGFIPYVIQNAYGTSAFGVTDDTYPLLYPGYQSSVYQRSSLFFTVVSSLAFRLANPQWAQIGVPEGEEAIDLNFTEPHVYPLGPGQTVTDMNTQLNRDLFDILTVLMGKSEEVSVSKVIAGQNPGGVTAASSLNLLTHGGKLQLLPVQIAVQELYNGLVDMIFQYIRLYDEIDPEASTIDLWTPKGLQRIDPATLPDFIEVDTHLDVDLPQDKAAMVNMAVNAWKSRAISQRTAWQWMGIQDVNEEQRRIDYETARGMAPQLNAPQSGQMSTQEGVLPEAPAENPTSQTPEQTQQEVVQNMGGGAR